MNDWLQHSCDVQGVPATLVMPEQFASAPWEVTARLMAWAGEVGRPGHGAPGARLCNRGR